MSYLGVNQNQIAAAVFLVIRHLLHQQQESMDSLIVNGKQKIFTYQFLVKSEMICLQMVICLQNRRLYIANWSPIKISHCLLSMHKRLAATDLDC